MKPANRSISKTERKLPTITIKKNKILRTDTNNSDPPKPTLTMNLNRQDMRQKPSTCLPKTTSSPHQIVSQY